MDPCGLVPGHASNPVRALKLASFGDPWLAPHTDPDHGQPLKRSPQPSLRVPAVEEHLVNDDARAGASNGREPSYQAASALRNFSPTAMEPSGANSMEPAAPPSVGP